MDVNLKEMMFDQRMKEIEDDVVPFGFINDGRDEDEAVLEEDMGVWKVDRGWELDRSF